MLQSFVTLTADRGHKLVASSGWIREEDIHTGWFHKIRLLVFTSSFTDGLCELEIQELLCGRETITKKDFNGAPETLANFIILVRCLGENAYDAITRFVHRVHNKELITPDDFPRI